MDLRMCIILGAVAVLLAGCGTLDRLARWRLGEETAREIEREAIEKTLDCNEIED